MKNYEDFVKKYGKRPPDIVCAVTRKDTLEEVGDWLVLHCVESQKRGEDCALPIFAMLLNFELIFKVSGFKEKAIAGLEHVPARDSADQPKRRRRVKR